MSEEVHDVFRGWVDLYHPSGASVKLPVFPCVSEEAAVKNGQAMMQHVTGMLAAGFLVRPPGIEAVEEKAEAGAVVRREVEDKETKEITPVVDLYSANPRAVFKILKVYLNKEEDIAAFEKASGMRLASMPIYVGSGDIERGKSSQLDKFVVNAPRPFQVIFKPNPKYKEEDAKKAAEKGETYPIAKKKFVRWSEASSKSAQGKTQESNGEPKTEDVEYAAEVLWWRHFLAKDPPVAEVTEMYRSKVMAVKDRSLATAVWNGPLEAWRTQTGCEWDKKLGFVSPQENDDYGGPY